MIKNLGYSPPRSTLSRKHTKSHGTSPCFIDKSTINENFQEQIVKLPELRPKYQL